MTFGLFWTKVGSMGLIWCILDGKNKPPANEAQNGIKPRLERKDEKLVVGIDACFCFCGTVNSVKCLLRVIKGFSVHFKHPHVKTQ